MANKMLYVFQL